MRNSDGFRHFCFRRSSHVVSRWSTRCLAHGMSTIHSTSFQLILAQTTAKMTTMRSRSLIRPALNGLRTTVRPTLSRPYILPSRSLPATRISPITKPVVAVRWKSEVSRSKWAENPMITFDELKPITEHPSDVSLESLFAFNQSY